MSRAGLVVRLGTDDGTDPASLLRAMAHRGAPRGELELGPGRAWVVSHDEQGDGWDLHEGGADDGWAVVLHGRTLPPGPVTAADVAGVLAEEGPGGLRHVLGPFAVVARHAASGAVVLARDCAGERPLFTTSGRSWVATDQAVLLARPAADRHLDEVGVASTLARYLELGPRTLWRAVHRVQPGTALTLHSDGTTSVADLWPAVPVRPRSLTRTTLVDEYVALLHEVVAGGLPADGRVLCDVSGGLDSSSVAVVLAKLLPDADRRLVSLTTVFDDVPVADERAYAEAVLERLPGERVVVRPQARPAADLVAEARRTSERPAAPNSVPPDVLGPIAASGATRWYGGTGGDELVDAGPAALGRLLRTGRMAGALTVARDLGSEQLGRAGPRATLNALWGWGLRPVVRAAVRRAGLGRRARPPEEIDAAWLNRLGVTPPDPGREARIAVGRPAGLVLDALRSPYSTLVNEASEREASLVGLEILSPLQDRRLWDLALAIPDELRLQAGDHRWFQRQVPGLPGPVAERRTKAEFSVQMAEGISAYLDDPGALTAISGMGWVAERDPDALRARLRRGRWNQGWAIVSVDAWLRGAAPDH